jgi:hypothetical protein
MTITAYRIINPNGLVLGRTMNLPTAHRIIAERLMLRPNGCWMIQPYQTTLRAEVSDD